MSVYPELTRLTAMLTLAEADPYSCPRNRAILQARINDLKEEANQVGLRQAKMIQECEAEAKRLREQENPQPLEAAAVEQYLDNWLEMKGHNAQSVDHVDLWETEHQY